jgi:signal transduction histidine kinase
VRRRQLSARARLTLLYTGLVAVGGAVVVAITYGLVAQSLSSASLNTAQPTQDFLNACQANARAKGVANPKQACVEFFAQGAVAGARAQRASTLDHLLGYSIGALALVTALTAVAGWVLAGRILAPVRQLTAAARDASEHTLGRRLALTGPHDELRELADTFDAMLARLDAAFSAQRRFIANAGHEVRTPLTVMRTTLDVVLAKPAPTVEELRTMGEDVRRAVDYTESLVDALLTLARNDRSQLAAESVDLATVAENALDDRDLRGLVLDTRLDPAPLRGDPVLLERLVANLLDNAARYNLPDDGRISVATWADDGHSVVQVANTGPVVPPAAVPSLFEPFRRLQDRVGHDGFGLGLPLVASIAAAHDGTVDASAQARGGLTVTVRLPAAAPTEAEPG